MGRFLERYSLAKYGHILIVHFRLFLYQEAFAIFSPTITTIAIAFLILISLYTHVVDDAEQKYTERNVPNEYIEKLQSVANYIKDQTVWTKVRDVIH